LISGRSCGISLADMTRLRFARRRGSVAAFFLSACALLTLLVSGASTTHDHTHGVGLYNPGCPLLALAVLGSSAALDPDREALHVEHGTWTGPPPAAIAISEAFRQYPVSRAPPSVLN
jgi:hypothetical protein